MGKRKMYFEHISNVTYCLLKHKKYLGVGVAEFEKSDLETNPTKLVGETVAYLKAKRDICKQQLADKKQQFKYLDDFSEYMFPKKYDKSLRDWLYPRGEKYLTKIQDEIEALEKDIAQIDQAIIDYLCDKQVFLKKLAKKREK